MPALAPVESANSKTDTVDTGGGTTTPPQMIPGQGGAYPHTFTNPVLEALGQKKGMSAQKKPSQHLTSTCNNFTDHLLERSEMLRDLRVAGND